MILPRLYIFLFFFGILTNLSAQSLDFNLNCERAYTHIIALKADSATYYLNQEKRLNPSNHIIYLLDNYMDFLEIYTSGSTKLYEAKKSSFDDRISSLKKADNSSPYYLYSQAEIHLQSAVLHIKFGEYFACIFDAKKALKKLEQNQKDFPDFMPNNKSLGTLYTILGSIPEQYQGGLEFLGLKGSVLGGLSMLEKATNSKKHPFQHESATIYAFMLMHIQNKPEAAWQILQKNNFNSSKNLMDAYSLGHVGIYGIHNDEGISALTKASRSGFMDFPLMDYLLGIGKTYRQDSDANVYFEKFISKTVGIDYIKSAWHKMAWNALIQGDRKAYDKYIDKLKNSGRAVVDSDKQAQREVESGIIPNPLLLQVRLLTDGNYLDRAFKLLDKVHVNNFQTDYEKTEYYYRVSRVYDKKGLSQKAIQYYSLTIANGKRIPFYYAANSAYLLGFLYEQLQNKEAALKNYSLCLELPGYEYENSIHMKAEAAINRLKN